mgnify:FL=1
MIGKILQDNLRKNGHELVLLDKKIGIDILTADISSYMTGVESVIHLAGFAGPKISEQEMKENVLMTFKVIESAAKKNVLRVLYSSSIHVYNFSNIYLKGEKITATTPLKIHSNPKYYKDNEEKNVPNYSMSKILSEKLNEVYYQQYGLNILNLRFWAVTKDNKPADNPWGSETWLSHEDLTGIIKKSLEFEGLASLVCVSNNSEKFVDLKPLKRILGYMPKSNSANI